MERKGGLGEEEGRGKEGSAGERERVKGEVRREEAQTYDLMRNPLNPVQESQPKL